MCWFYVACEAWSTHRDHDSVDVVVRGVTLLVSVQLLGCIDFIQSLQKGKPSLNTGQVRIWRSSAKFCFACEAWSTLRDHMSASSSASSHFWFPIDNFEGMHQFHSNFTEGSINDNHHQRDATILFTVYRRVKHHKIHAKFEFGGQSQTFD